MKIYQQKPKIVVSSELKEKLDKIKKYQRETYEDIIWRLIKNDILPYPKG
jgi:hypothetical protein